MVNLTTIKTAANKWLPSTLLQASALTQLGGWPLSLLENAPEGLVEALLLNHGVIAAAGLWPQSPWLGPNQDRLPAERAACGEIALTFDDGPDPEVTPKVLDLLDAHGATASFFCIAERARRHPELLRAICARGHLVENHSLSHRWHFAFQGIGRLRGELRQAQAEIADITGRAPVFFRAPFGFRNPWMGAVVSELDLQLVSWTRRGYDAVIGHPGQVARRLTRRLTAGDIILLHDGSSARHGDRPVVLDVLPTVLAAITSQGCRARSLGAGPMI
ncbi:MAG: polysaccharide deacetylase family protein [Methylococcaceae bacterium]|jgi:peptidoglycan/xylan/chitin deacetylase (PgdA/CDA1 family)